MPVDDEIYGTDYSSHGGVTATGDIELVTGLDNARQSIHNWLLTDKGYYPSVDTEYGSEIREVLGEDYEEKSIEALKVYIRNALLDNPRVQTINSIEPYTLVDKTLLMKISVELVNGSTEEVNITIED